MNKIITEQSNSVSSDIDLMSTTEILQTINNEDKKVALAVERVLPEIAKAVDLITNSFLNNGRIAYFGAGTSGRLGILDASECWPTFSAPREMIRGFIAGGEQAITHEVKDAEDSIENAINDLNAFAPTSNDIVIAISASGNPLYLLKILEEAHKRNVRTIGITSNPNAQITKLCDICITTIVGPEIITGSSRMKSGTAQKMILNMLTTASMIKIGKTYGNYMIDLQLVNNKLIERGNNIIASICNIPIAKADEYRIKAENSIKTACVMYLKQCSKQHAEQMLQKNNGILRKVINNG